MKNTLKKLKRIIIWFLQTWPRRALAGFLIVLFVISPFYFLFFRVPEAQAEWFDESWMYRQAITLTNSTGSDLTDFQVAVTVNTSGLISAGKMQSACQDMRFTDKNGQVLDYWIEENNPGCGDTSTKVWLKVPTVADGTDATTVYFYYGNSLASDMQNGDNVFEFFDDFNDNFINTEKWQDTTGTNTIQDSFGGKSGVLQSSGDANDIRFFSNYSTDTSYIAESQYATTGDGGLFFDAQDSNNGHLIAIRDEDSSDGVAQINWYKRESGTWTSLALASSNPVINDSTFYQYKIIKDGSNISVSQNEVEYINSSDLTFVSGGGVGIRGTSTSYVDYIFVRQYASADPSSSVGSEETGPGPVAYWQFDEGYGTTAHDSNIQGRDLTINNASWQTEEQCVSGKCMYFDGSGDYLSGQSNILEQDYTISLWVKPQNGAEIFWENETQLQFNSGNRFQFRHWTGTAYFLYSDSDKSYNQWYHVVITHDSSDGLKLYVDGVLEDSDPAGTAANSSGTLYIGKEESTNYLKGFVDEIKVYDYARSADQVKNDYNAGVGGGSGEAGVFLGGGSQKWMSDGLVGHWKMDESSWNGTSGEVIDSSGNGNNGTAAGGVTTGAGKFGYGGSFAGDDDIVDAGTGSTLNSTSEITLATWIKPTGSGYRGVMSRMDASTGGNGYILRIDPDDNINFILNNGGSRVGEPDDVAIDLDTWNFVVATFDGTNRKIYINGELQNTFSGGAIGSSSQRFIFGAYEWGSEVGSPYYFNGQMDETRVYNRALSPDEVRHLYEWAPGPVGHWKLDENTSDYAYDSSGTGNTGTLTNMESSDWTVGKYGGATQFDGVDEYIDFGDPVDGSLDMGTKNFTVSFWAKPDGTINSGHDTIVGKKGGAWAGRGWLFRTPNASTINFHVANESAYDEASTSITAGVWQYITGVRDGTTLYLYINGVLKSTDTNAIYDDDVSSTISLKSGYLAGWNRWAGTVDDIKIYDYARNQKQIVSDMSAQGRSASGGNAEPLLYLNFDEGYGTTAHDLGFGQDDGELYDGPSWTNNGKFGKALDFDGTNDRVEAFSSNPLEYTGGGLTISLWANIDSAESTGGNLVCKPWNGNGEYNYCLQVNSSDLLGISMRGATAWSTTTTATLTADTWSHVLVTIDGTDDSVKIYKDGELVKSDNYNITSWTPVNPDTNVSLCIGSLYPYGAGWAGNTGYAFDGQIDEFKIYNYALSEEEVKKEYNHGTAMQLGSSGTENDGATSSQSASRAYCVPGDTSTCSPPVGEWKFDEKTGTTAYDTSGNGNDGTLTSMDASTDWVVGKVGAALDFDGDNDYVDFSSADIVGASAGTVEAWVNASNWDANRMTVFSSEVGPDWVNLRLVLFSNSNNSLTFSVANGTSSTTDNVNTGTILNANEWYHVVGTYDGSVVKIYVNGAEKDSYSTSIAPGTFTPTKTVAGWHYSDRFWNGKIDDVKIYDYARTPAQIAWDYNRGAPVGWWKMDEGEGTTAHDASGNSNHGALTNMDSTTDWVSGQFNSALDFDGSDDYILIDSSDYKFQSGDFSATIWANSDALDASYEGLFTTDSTSDVAWKIIRDTGSSYFQARYGSTILDFSSVSAGQWHHYVMTKSGTTLTIYQDGKLVTSDTCPSTYTGGSDQLVLGSYRVDNAFSGAYMFDGKMDDARIYNYSLTAEQVKQIYNNGAINFR